MPLKRREKSDLVDSTSCILSKREFSSFIFAVALVLIFVLIGGFVIAIDYGLSSLLVLIRTHGDTTLFYRGGAGFTAYLPSSSVSPSVRDLLMKELPQVFDNNSTRLLYESSADTGKCLPIANPPFLQDQTKVVVLAVLYVTVFCVSLLQAYGLRLQHKVAAYFYPEVEEKRMVYLYHSIRAQRVSIKGLLYKKIKNFVLRRDKSNSDAVGCRMWILLSHPRLKHVLEMVGVIQKIDCSMCGSEILSGGRKFADNVYACDLCLTNVRTSKRVTVNL